jgi:hypothetical protein
MANGLRPFALPRPMPQGVSYVQVSGRKVAEALGVGQPPSLGRVLPRAKGN